MIKKTSTLATVFTLLTALILSGCAPSASQGITITDAWVRASEYSDHVGGMTGIFAKITNNSDQDVILTGGTSDIAPVIQTHEVVGGMMQQTENGIKIAAGETVTLEPGGYHVMLMGLKRAIVAGDHVEFNFTFDNGHSEKFDLVAKVSDGGDETYNK